MLYSNAAIVSYGYEAASTTSRPQHYTVPTLTTYTNATNDDFWDWVSDRFGGMCTIVGAGAKNSSSFALQLRSFKKSE